MRFDNKVVAIVVTYNGSQWIEKCLQSLLNSTYRVQIIVVDNASTDNTIGIIEKKFPETDLIKNKKNLGFGKANNVGMKIALERNAEFVFLLNQDAWIDTNTIEGLLHASEMHPEYGILSPYHLDYEGSATEKYFEDWVLNYYTQEYGTDKKNGIIKEVYTTSFVHAACWLMPISTLKDVGGFDPLFFHYGEDNDYVQRLHDRRKKIGIVPAVKVYHFGSNDGLKSPHENIPFLANQILQRLKSPSASHLGAFVLFIRQYWKVLKGSDAALRAAYQKNFKRLLSIFISRFTQNKARAYLN